MTTSEIDDIDFVSTLIQKTEKFVCQEISKIRSELSVCHKSLAFSEAKAKEQEETINRLKTDIAKLHGTIQGLEMENKILAQEIQNVKAELDLHKGTTKGAFSAALQTLTQQTMDVTPVEDTELVQNPDISVVHGTTTSTPIQDHKLRACKVDLGKRQFKAESSSTSQIYTDIDSVPEDMKTQLQPFVMEKKYNTKDRLNSVQRAFIKYKANQMVKTGQRLNESYINNIIQEGVAERFWTEQFKPSPDLTLHEYMQNRLKNERKSNMRRQMMSTQNERISMYLEDQMSAIEESSVGEKN